MSVKVNKEFNINDFYKWASQCYMAKEMSTHPINWITLAKYSDMFQDGDRQLLTGLDPMINAMKTQLVNRKYEYVASPCAFEKLKNKASLKNWDVKNLAPIYYGILSFENDEFYLSGFEKTKIPVKKTWILKEVK